MTIVEPSHKEIMQYLDCCYYSRWHKGQCECHMPSQFNECYEYAKKRLTRHILSEEEIRQGQEKNEKSMAEIYKISHELFD